MQKFVNPIQKLNNFNKIRDIIQKAIKYVPQDRKIAKNVEITTFDIAFV